MIVEKTAIIKAPRQTVWNMLMDIPFVASCVPGLENLETAGDGSYKALFKVKVAYISASFDMLISIINARGPEHFETVAEGKGHLGIGRVKQTQTIDLRAISDTETEASYKGELVIVGKLAVLGEKAVGVKVNQFAEQFVGALTARCEGR